MSISVLRRASLAVMPLALAAALTACGGGSSDSGSSGSGTSGGRPSASDLARALQSESSELTPAGATCLAQAMENSSLSDQMLQAVVKDDQNYKPSASDAQAVKAMTSKLYQCVAASMPSGIPSGLPSSGAAPSLP